MNTKPLPPSICLYDVYSQEDDTEIPGGLSVLKYDPATNEVTYLTHSDYADGEGGEAANAKKAIPKQDKKNLVPN